MNDKETLYFIAKCLTLSYEEKNRKEVLTILKNKETDWDKIVKVCTAHFVFPGLYCNFREMGFLKYLPEDLVKYMKHIYTLNHERNTEIMKQIHEINSIFIKENIPIIFLKGAAFLLDNLYKDIGERMVGDIDVLVDAKNFEKSIDLLKNDGYKRINNKEHFKFLNKHYPKIFKENNICSLEVHNDMVLSPYNSFFNYATVVKKTNSGFTTLSHKDQIIYNCFNKQINDKAQWYKYISLRNSYDIFLLSKKTSAALALKDFNFFFEYLNNYLASSFHLFNESSSLKYTNNDKTKKYLKKESKVLLNPTIHTINTVKWDIYYYVQVRFLILRKSLFDRKTRKVLFRRVYIK